MRRSSIAVSLCVSSLLLAEASIAQPPPAQPGPPNPQQQQQNAGGLLPNVLFDRIPGAAETPAMDWIRPGTRLVFFSTNAVTQTNPGQMGMRRDPNGPIVDDKGNRWTMSDSTGDSGGGVGWTAIDVVASEPGRLVLDVRTYFLPQGKGGPAKFVSSTGLITHPSGCDFFLHPRLLNQVPSVDTPNVNIIRQLYEMNNQRFNAMRVTVRNQGLSSNVYDLSSGVLLFSRSAAVQSQGQVLDPNGNITNAGATATGTHSFVGSREVNLPWRNSQMPAWVKQVRKLTYSGAMISRSPASQGLPDLSTPLSVEIVTKQVGETWSLHEVTTMLSTNVTGVANIPSVNELATGPASSSGVWIDPNFLKQLQTGQAIDQDQSIGTQTMVEFAGAGSDGRPIVALTTVTALQKSTNVYDATDGKLIQIIRTEANPNTSLTTITQLNLVGME